jgi:hypothetical protein
VKGRDNLKRDRGILILSESDRNRKPGCGMDSAVSG